ncbi:hypothetical protein [Candidatus Vidania fulgoroideorum]
MILKFIRKRGKKIQLRSKKLRKDIYISLKYFKKLNIKIKKKFKFIFFNKKLSINNYFISEDLNRIKKKYKKKKKIIGKVTKKVKGGLEIKYKSLKCFLPNSLISDERYRDIDNFLNKKYFFKIVKIENNNIIVSRIKKKKKKNIIIKNLEFKIITNYGIFVRYKKYTGLLLLNKKNKKILKKYLENKKKIPITIKKIDKIKKKFSFKINFLELYKKKTFFEYSIKDKKKLIFNYIDYQCYLYFKNLSWVNYFNYFEIKNNKKIKILNFIIKKNRIIIFLKQCLCNPWKIFKKNYRINDYINVIFFKNKKKYLIFKIPMGLYAFSPNKKIKKKMFIKFINLKKKIIFINNI